MRFLQPYQMEKEYGRNSNQLNKSSHFPSKPGHVYEKAAYVVHQTHKSSNKSLKKVKKDVS